MIAKKTQDITTLSCITYEDLAVAIYHLSVKHASRAKGRSALRHAAYLTGRESSQEISREPERVASGEGRAVSHAAYITREPESTETLSRDDLVHTESGNMPAWAHENALDFWQAADRYERANGRLYTEIEVALPRELTPDQRLELVRDFVGRHLGARHPYTLALHTPRALDGLEQPHAHLQLSERTLDGLERDPVQFFQQTNHRHPERGGAPKARDWNRREKVLELRVDWSQTVNQALERAGHVQRIDHRSLEAQGLDRQPEPKLYREETERLRQGREPQSERGHEVLALRQGREQFQRLEREIAQTRGQIIDLTRERERRQGREDEPEASRPGASTLDQEVARERGLGQDASPPERAGLGDRAEVSAPRRDQLEALVARQTPEQAEARLAGLVARHEVRMEQRRQALEHAWEQPLRFATHDRVQGRLGARVEIEGQRFARVVEQGETIVLVPWRADMAQFRGREVHITMDPMGEVSRVLGVIARATRALDHEPPHGRQVSRQRGRILDPEREDDAPEDRGRSRERERARDRGLER